MPDRILSAGSAAAAIAALFLFAAQDAAQAARCPLGEIYRPSRGICVSKQQAIQAGVYRGAAPARIEAVAEPVQTTSAKSETPVGSAPVPKPRPQALAEIERRAPVKAAKANDALAFVTDRKTASEPQAQPSATQAASRVMPAALRGTDASPFGSLVALEPTP